MLNLQSNHIVDLYSWVDDNLPVVKNPKGGRPCIMSDNEVITLLIWNVIALHQKTLKDIHTFTQMYLNKEFPKISKYKNFVAQCHKVTPMMYYLLNQLLQNDELQFVDSTMLEVCTLKRAENYKVAKNLVNFGKNWQGWHYGFKLHATTNIKGQLCNFTFSPASQYDAQELPNLLNDNVKILVGDTLYGASVMRKIMHKKYRTIIISPPFPKQDKKMATPFQNHILSERSRIESVFGILKTRLHLVSSFPRSVRGYFVHYIRILLGYQILALSKGF